MKNNLDNDWNIIDTESKWNFIDNLENKDKIKLYLIDKYKKISPFILYSLKLCYNKNNYLNIITNTINIINNNKLITYTNNKFEYFKLYYDYNQAFKYGYLNMIHICYNLLSPSLIEINNNLYNNYDNEIIIENINKEFIIIYNNLRYIFIYQQFLYNIGFQKNLQDYVKNNINNILLVFNSNKSNKFIIKIIYKL